MAARKTVEKATEIVEEAGEAVEASTSVSFDDLSDDLKAILEESEAVEAELEAEFKVISRKILVRLTAQFRVAQKTGFNVKRIMERAYAIDEAEGEENEDLGVLEKLELKADAIFSLVEAIVGSEKAAEWLKEVGGDKLSFAPIVDDLLKLTSVKKV